MKSIFLVLYLVMVAFATLFLPLMAHLDIPEKLQSGVTKSESISPAQTSNGKLPKRNLTFSETTQVCSSSKSVNVHNNESITPANTAISVLYNEVCKAEEAEIESISIPVRRRVNCTNLYDYADEHQAAALKSILITSVIELDEGEILLIDHDVPSTGPANCTVLFFFAPWCKWSAKAAPHLNALSRAFRNIVFIAVNVDDDPSIITAFGVYGIPNVLLFYNGGLIGRYRNESITTTSVASFLEIYTDQKRRSLKIKKSDYIGPLSSVPETNVYESNLITTSWWVITLSATYFLMRSEFVMKLFLCAWMQAQSALEDDEFNEPELRY